MLVRYIFFLKINLSHHHTTERVYIFLLCVIDRFTRTIVYGEYQSKPSQKPRTYGSILILFLEQDTVSTRRFRLCESVYLFRIPIKRTYIYINIYNVRFSLGPKPISPPPPKKKKPFKIKKKGGREDDRRYRYLSILDRDVRVAQTVEYWSYEPNVDGSIPPSNTFLKIIPRSRRTHIVQRLNLLR